MFRSSVTLHARKSALPSDVDLVGFSYAPTGLTSRANTTTIAIFFIAIIPADSLSPMR
jgi:hypothetical protein